MQPDLAPLAPNMASTDEWLELLQCLAGDIAADTSPQSELAATLWQDDDFQRRYRTLAIQRLGISALAARMGDDQSLQLALAWQLETLCRGLAELAISSLGYYALPSVDPLLIDNEGSIGHHLALPIMRALEGYFEAPAAAGREPAAAAKQPPAADAGETLKNRIANRIFNTD